GRTGTTDGSVHVTLDKSGTAHTFFPYYVILKDVQSDTGYNRHIPSTDAIFYWNDNAGVAARVIAQRSDTSLTPLQGNTDPKKALYSSLTISTLPVACVDDSNFVYMVYSSP